MNSTKKVSVIIRPRCINVFMSVCKNMFINGKKRAHLSSVVTESKLYQNQQIEFDFHYLICVYLYSENLH